MENHTNHTSVAEVEETWTMRFPLVDRVMHAVLFTTFLGLSLTGLPLLFSDAPWAATMAVLLGGYGVTGALHRLCGVLMLACFAAHLGRVAYKLAIKRNWGVLWGPDSLVPQPRDFVDLYHHVRWFLGLGPRPKFDRFAYWEKFDYWAVFWGMGIIGLSGLILWFPHFLLAVLLRLGVQRRSDRPR